MFKLFIEDLKQAASFLEKSWKEYTVTQLANMLCQAMDDGDDLMINATFSGLMLHYQPMMVKMYQKHGRVLKMEIGDIASWFSRSIMQACDPKNRTWQKKEKNCSAGTVINQILNTRYIAMAYYESNLDLHKANFATTSLDAPLDYDTDDTRADLLVSEYPTPSDQFSGAYAIIQDLLDDNKIIEAIIAETIAYNDCYKVNSKTVKEVGEDGTVKKYKNISTEFWAYRAVQILSNLPENYEDYFLDRFNVDKEMFETGLNKIRTSKNPKLYEYLESTKNCLRSIL